MIKDSAQRKYYRENREKLIVSASIRNKQAAKERKAAGMCVRCGNTPAIEGQVRCGCCSRALNDEGKARRLRQKALCYDHYGRICKCCGESQERFLTLDHVNNDGNIHRQTLSGGDKLYQWAIKEAFPESLQTLCWNCQMGKMFNGGVCPHATSKVGA